MTARGQQNILVENSEVSLKELLLTIQKWRRYLLSKWIIILMFGLLGGLLGFSYAYFKNPIYTATTTFVLEDEKSGGGLGNLAGLASIAGVDLGGSGGDIFQGENILELYRSRKMLQQTLLTDIIYEGNRQKLVERYIDFNQLKKQWVARPELLKLTFETDSIGKETSFLKPNRLRDSVLNSIVNDLIKYNLVVAKVDKKLSIIKVDLKAKDEYFAKSFNQALVKNVNDFYVQTKTQKSLQNVKILDQKTDSVRSVMNGAIYTSVAVVDATPNLNPIRQIQRVAPAQKAQFSAETNKAILSSLVQNLEMSKLTLMKETPLLQVIDEPIFPLPIEKTSPSKALLIGVIVFMIISCILLLIRRMFLNL
jgi:hypothetical protein